MCSSAIDDIDDDATVIISNVSSNKRSRKSFKAQALNHLVKTENTMFAGLCLDTYDVIADSGATQIFVMDGTPVVNKRPTTRPLKVALADGRIVLSTHMCDIKIDRLPTFVHVCLRLRALVIFWGTNMQKKKKKRSQIPVS